MDQNESKKPDAGVVMSFTFGLVFQFFNYVFGLLIRFPARCLGWAYGHFKAGFITGMKDSIWTEDKPKSKESL